MTERTIFLQALERESGAARTAFLDESCAGDADLRRRVEDLIQSHSEAGSFLGQPVLAEAGASGVTPGGDTETHAPDAAAGEVSLDFLSPSDKPGSLGRLDHYEVMSIVGRGGMGIVLKAFDEKLHRVVALKVMTRDIAGNAASRKRFSREAKAAAAVVHDHIVPIHAIEESGTTPYLVMQFIQGQSLQQKIDAEGSLELKEILRIGMQIASGLAAAHKQGLVHRDIKPSNILLENGVQRVKITDFGLARAVDDASVSQSGIVAGTPQYMSPEQADGQPVDHRSDLFSLGSVMYAMCTGRPPFRAASTVATLKRVCEDTPRPIRELNPDMPEWLAELIGKLHGKNPADRFQSAKDVAEVLERHLAAAQQPGAMLQPAVASPAAKVKPWEEHVVRWMLGTLAFGGIVQLVFLGMWLTRGKLFGWAAGACAVALAVLVTYFAYYLWKRRPAERGGRHLTWPACRRIWRESEIGIVSVAVIVGALLLYSLMRNDDGDGGSSRPSGRVSVRQLQQLIDAQEVAVNRVKQQFDGGLVSATELTAAEIDLLEARIRLAEAVTNKREQGLLLNQLVEKRLEQLRSAEQRFAAGATAHTEVEEAKKRVIEARIRAGNDIQTGTWRDRDAIFSAEILDPGTTVTLDLQQDAPITSWTFGTKHWRQTQLPAGRYTMRTINEHGIATEMTTLSAGEFRVMRLPRGIDKTRLNDKGRILKSFDVKDALASPEDVRIDGQKWQIKSAGEGSKWLFNLSRMNLENCVVVYRARLQTDWEKRAHLHSQSGTVLPTLAMYCSNVTMPRTFPRFGSFNLYANPSAWFGQNLKDGCWMELVLFLEKGEILHDFSIGVQMWEAGECTVDGVELRVIPLTAHGKPDLGGKNSPTVSSPQPLDGHWVAVAAEFQGRQLSRDEMMKTFPPDVTIKGSQYGVHWDGNTHEGTLNIDSSTNPAQMDFTGSVFDSLKPRKAIYKLEGDTLTVCLPHVGPGVDPPRPTEFRTSAESKNAVLTYRRAN